jgi:hypothetical protein
VGPSIFLRINATGTLNFPCMAVLSSNPCGLRSLEFYPGISMGLLCPVACRHEIQGVLKCSFVSLFHQ